MDEQLSNQAEKQPQISRESSNWELYYRGYGWKSCLIKTTDAIAKQKFSLKWCKNAWSNMQQKVDTIFSKKKNFSFDSWVGEFSPEFSKMMTSNTDKKQ